MVSNYSGTAINFENKIGPRRLVADLLDMLKIGNFLDLKIQASAQIISFQISKRRL